jgi:hypothetical protein
MRKLVVRTIDSDFPSVFEDEIEVAPPTNVYTKIRQERQDLISLNPTKYA